MLPYAHLYDVQRLLLWSVTCDAVACIAHGIATNYRVVGLPWLWSVRALCSECIAIARFMVSSLYARLLCLLAVDSYDKGYRRLHNVDVIALFMAHLGASPRPQFNLRA